MKSRLSRTSQRGAIMVESIIVISFFTICFFGVLYFRDLYLGKMRVQRLARASAMAHAMGACKVDPKAGLEGDLPLDAPNPPEQRPIPGDPADLKTTPGTTADDALQKFDRTKRGTPLDEITQITLTTSASAGKKEPGSSAPHFESSVSSQSFVTCGDPVSDDDFTEIIPHITDVFSSFF